jgi:hypothetical protein
LLRHGDEQLPVELQSATIRLLRWACSVCEGQLNVWVKKGFAILNECLAQSFAALADDLSDELPSLVKLLRKSGLDNTEGSEGLVSKAQQAPRSVKRRQRPAPLQATLPQSTVHAQRRHGPP